MNSLFKSYTLNVNALMVVAALLYSTWPLGYWFNPSANQGLASNLEALSQPYNWLFIILDVVSGLIICYACWKLFNFINSNSVNKTRLGLRITVIGTGIFGLFTSIDALLPLNCIQGTPGCLDPLYNPYFITHGIFSIGSIAGLSVSIFCVWLLLFARDKTIMRQAHLTPAMFMVIWLGFGAFTAILVFHNQSSGNAQHVFITFCSLWLVTLPYFVGQIIRLKPTPVL